MQTARSTTCSRASSSGFTLLELMVVLVIIGVMIGMSAPRFERVIEQSRADIAAANLRAIWAAERLYWLENHKYADLQTLQDSGLLDSQLPRNVAEGTYKKGSYSYEAVSDPPLMATFTARATHLAGSRWTGAFTIDQTGAIPDTDALHATGQRDITPGFQ